MRGGLPLCDLSIKEDQNCLDITVGFFLSFSITQASFDLPLLVLNERAALQRFVAVFSERTAEENEEAGS